MGLHTKLFLLLEHAREYLRFAACAHLFGRYTVCRSLLRVVWVWSGAQHASNSRDFCSSFIGIFCGFFVGTPWPRYIHPHKCTATFGPSTDDRLWAAPSTCSQLQHGATTFFGAGRRPAPWTFTRSRPTVFSDVRHSRHRRVLHWQRPLCAASPKDSLSGTRTTPLSPRTTAPQCARAPARLTTLRSTERFSLGRSERGQGRGSSERERMLPLCEPRWLI